MSSRTQTGTSHSGSLFSALCSGFWPAFSPFSCSTTDNNERRDAHELPERIHHRLCFHPGVSPGLGLAAVRGRIFPASTLEHGASPAAQYTRGDFPGILGRRVG